MLKFADSVTDVYAFYLLPGGQSTILRNKRLELVSKKSEYAEIGTRARAATRPQTRTGPRVSSALLWHR